MEDPFFDAEEEASATPLAEAVAVAVDDGAVNDVMTSVAEC